MICAPNGLRTAAPVLVIGAFVLVAAAGTAASGTAQVPATPTTACDVAPRSVAELRAISGTPVPKSGVPPTPPPAGAPADAAMVGAVTEVVRTMEACLNAGDRLRLFSLMTANALLAGGPFDEEALADLAAATPQPLVDGEQAQFVGPWDVRVQPDGRVTAVVLMENVEDPDLAPGRTVIMVFVREDGRWLIDQIIDKVMVRRNKPPVYVAEFVGTPPADAPD